jgi:hypothetical protein
MITGLVERLAGLQAVAETTITFSPAGHGVRIRRLPAAPAWLADSVLGVSVFCNYYAQVLHALGSGSAGDECRRHISLSALTVRAPNFPRFLSWIDTNGTCLGRLLISSRERLSMTTDFRVPVRGTNNYLIDSTMILFEYVASDAVGVADAVESMEDFFDTVAGPSTLEGLRDAANVGLHRYLQPLPLSRAEYPSPQRA